MSEKLLIVDDSKASRDSIRKTLKDVFPDFIEADNGLTAIRLFGEERPGFIITGVEMPKMDGYKLVSTIRGLEGGSDVPVIMFSGKKPTLKSKLDGLNIGASDYLFKPFDNEELVARVKCLLRVRKSIEGLLERNALLEKLAVTDTLTGLYNRRYFFDAAKEQMALGLRHSFRIACLLIDIDHFKKINDTWGHQAGDDVLRNVGRLLLAKKRDGELMARFGGEEFIICLFNTDQKSAVQAAHRFRNALKTHDFTSAHHPPLHITVSIGLAIYPQDGILTIDELISAADMAMYRSKRDGRDRVSCPASPTLSKGVRQPAGATS